MEAVYALPERSDLLAGGRTGEDEPAEAAVAHATHCEPRELERAVEIDAHGLAPYVRILLPHEPLVSRADAVVHNQQVNSPKPSLGLGDGQRTTLCRAEIGHDVFEADSRQFRRGARHDHDARARC
ncbi:MAG TPA: hypothetical protein VGP32_02265 [Steroidobacteraceae bacterium]|nr:hypothetical protein [Steroidobacteraceae bacterium]